MYKMNNCDHEKLRKLLFLRAVKAFTARNRHGVRQTKAAFPCFLTIGSLWGARKKISLLAY